MLERIDLDRQVPVDVYEKVFPRLEADLGECQRAARAAGVPVAIVFEGWEAAGKGTLINRVTQALDPRGFKVHSISPPTEDERLHPWLWRFWNVLPVAGSIAIFDCSWYGRVLEGRQDRRVSKAEWRRAYSDICTFEQQQSDAGVVIVKLWLHIGRAEQACRFKRLLAHSATAWKVNKAARRQNEHYKAWRRVAEDMLARTGTRNAPWTVVEATHGRFARVKVFETLVGAIRAEIDRRARRAAPAPAPMPAPPARRRANVITRADLSLTLERADYEKELPRLQERLFYLENKLYLARIPAVIVYEGVDAAGKGGNIKRLTRGLDPRGYEVVPVAAPTAEEKAHHYLWRFWRQVPKAGHITLFDRSWYGRVLVERVEGFCSPAEWRRAYGEINDFEQDLADFGAVIVKFYLLIDRAEQLRRFNERAATPGRQWKITDEDWRNRRKWPHYEVAAAEMIDRTNTPHAPWTVLEANSKLYARIKALRTVVKALEKALRARA